MISIGLAMFLLDSLGRVYYQRGINNIKKAIGVEEQNQGDNQYELTDEDVAYYTEEVEEAANAWGESIEKMLLRFNIQMSDMEWRAFVTSQRAGKTVASFGRLAVILGVILYFVSRRDIRKKNKNNKKHSARDNNVPTNDSLFTVDSNYQRYNDSKQNL